jgi:hypothetical protein
MLTIAITDPSKYELLIEAITIAMINNHEKATQYEQLIAELNSTLTRTIAVPTVGNRLYRSCGESSGVLPQTQGRPNSFGNNTPTSSGAIQGI